MNTMIARAANALAAVGVAMAVAWAASPAAGSTFTPPQNLPVPTPGKPNLPTPHPTIPVTYSLSCAYDDNNLTRAAGVRQWVVRNEGRNTAPVGLAFEISDQVAFYHANFTLRRALGPGASDVYGTAVTPLDHPVRREDPCEVTVAR